MRTLRFVGLDDAGTGLVLRSEDEQDHVLEVDERLVEAVRRTHGWRGQGRTAGHGDGQADAQVDTQTDDLRPREIQARVRAGESPEQVAASAGVDVERVVRFARPVLQEREHVAAAAQQVVVRTGALDGPLGEVVEDRLAHVVSDTETAWDSWRREDGRWTVALTFRDDVQQRTARWSFDPTTNSVTVDDETARWLTEGTAAPPAGSPPLEARTARGRRLLSVPDLAPEEASSAKAAYDEDEIADELAALGLQPVAEPTPVQEVLVEEVLVEEVVVTEVVVEAEPQAADHPDEPADTERATPAKKPARKASKRASVPSWDDIVFGARKPTE